MIKNQPIKLFIITLSDQCIDSLLIQTAHERHQTQKHLNAITYVLGCQFSWLGTQSFDIQADHPCFPIPMAIQHAHLIKGSSQIYGAEGAILIIFESILIV